MPYDIPEPPRAARRRRGGVALAASAVRASISQSRIRIAASPRAVLAARNTAAPRPPDSRDEANRGRARRLRPRDVGPRPERHRERAGLCGAPDARDRARTRRALQPLTR